MYPSDEKNSKVHVSGSKETHQSGKHIPLANAAVDGNLGEHQNVLGASRRAGHKRHFSAADMVDSVRKRLKRNGGGFSPLSPQLDKPQLSSTASSPESVPGSSILSPKPTVQCHPAVRPNERHVTTELVKPQADQRSSRPAPDDLKRSLLKRTWSSKKHHTTKTPISDPLSTAQNGISRPNISSPLASHASTDRPSTSLSTRTAASTSTNTNATTTHRPFTEQTPNTMHNDFEVEYVSGPKPKKNVLTRLGVPFSRAQLNTVVARQQSRIVDLTVLNDTLVGQVERLRGEVEDLKMSNGQPDSCLRGHYKEGSEPRVDQNILEASSRRDPDGWRRIVGVPNIGNADVGVEDDDRRKTWMTCDS